MATTFPRYNHIISKTLDPIFAILIGVSAAGIRIRREENEKRFGLATTSLVKPGPINPRLRPIASAGEAGFEEEGGEVEEIGFAEVARVGWERVWRRVSGEGVDG